MMVTDILGVDSIELQMKAESKDEVINKMIALAAKSGKISNIDEAKKEILNREAIMSTGVGKGIALPHAKTNAVTDSVGSLAILDEPVDFDSLDDKPVNIVFLILGREANVGNHLRLLSKISRMMNNDPFRSGLSKCKTTDEVLKMLTEIEKDQ